ncbi:hypothetical protein FC756_03170 [Lysinibacillus mangiferihumi]|uniref:Uncharacterized protein n=1 Tax=Lysinibacillus mangiferihumi TaxID=1130819 RepID=A0A4V5TMT9_9BACI|nr:hypothetical protein [Lysinibacillus mangiferihumi]TKI72023.1 hypothetical protein FC756_03170 [Lysinibacillus mangiferihumi]
MKRFAQILYEQAHWIFEADEKPEFAPDIVLVDITGRNDIQEGWDYNRETGEFTAPIVPEPTPIEPQPTVEEMQAQTLLNTEYLVSRSELGLGGN